LSVILKKISYENKTAGLKKYTLSSMRDDMTQEEQILYCVRTLDAEALERILWKRSETLELKNITTSKKSPCNMTNINKGMNFEKLAHGWWVDNGLFGHIRGYRMHPKIHSLGSVLHVLTSLYYEIRLSVFHAPLLKSYKTIFELLLLHGADPNHQLTHPFIEKDQFEKIYSDVNGQSPLHYAVAQFDVEGVTILLESGADPTLEYEGCRSVIQMLEDQKKNINKEIHPYSPYHTDIDFYNQDTGIMYDLVMKFKKDINL
jgi:hypothetical protein